MSLVVGAPAPDFSLPDAHGTPVTLEALRGSPALLVFFPHVFTPTCGGELAELQALVAAVRAEGTGVQIYAISCDPSAAQRAYADQEKLDFALLSDFWPHGEVSKAYDVFFEPRGFATRGSFLIDAEGVLRWSLVNGPGEPRDPEAHRAALASLQAQPAS